MWWVLNYCVVTLLWIWQWSSIIQLWWWWSYFSPINPTLWLEKAHLLVNLRYSMDYYIYKTFHVSIIFCYNSNSSKICHTMMMLSLFSTFQSSSVDAVGISIQFIEWGGLCYYIHYFYYPYMNAIDNKSNIIFLSISYLNDPCYWVSRCKGRIYNQVEELVEYWCSYYYFYWVLGS